VKVETDARRLVDCKDRMNLVVYVFLNFNPIM